MGLERDGFPMAVAAVRTDPALRAAVPTSHETGIDLRRGLPLDPRLQPAPAAPMPPAASADFVAATLDPLAEAVAPVPLAASADSVGAILDSLAEAASPVREQVGRLMGATIGESPDER